jgi:hypothetical protein
MVATAISRAVQQFGVGGCVGRMAQEFGDHPDAAASRMRWVRQLLAYGPSGRWRRRPSCHPGPHRRPSHVNHLTRHGDTAADLHTST